MRTLAVDLGTRRVGLALSDAGGKLATPYEVLEITSADDAQEQVRQVIRQEGVERVVVGLPLNMDGTPGPAAGQTIAWGAKLQEAATVPVVYVDERLSSFAADQRLLERKQHGEKLTRKKKKGRQDALAAAAFLQEFLDGTLEPIAAPFEKPLLSNPQT